MENNQDLIKDRALLVGEEDLFDHKSISNTIVDLIRSVSAPANIALYGPWGVGKSGLSNLIEARLLDIDEGYKYVRFDAFKYAQNPLRKHILSVMSDSLLCRSDSKAFKKTLYQSESTDLVKIPAVTVISMVITMIAVMIIIALAFSFIAAIFPLNVNGIALNYFEKVGVYIPEMILPSSILSAFISLWGKTFTTKTTKSAPSQEEEFEYKFKKLIKAATPLPTHKIVIFVDELDRCAGGDVVNALDTIRTFMDSDKCMFIVAVDKHVLSASFKAKLAAAGPLDKNNPQHGSVNEYLNKVFQYQINMPPLKPQRLTAFANDLVKDKGGIWASNLFKTKEVISILIPPYVNSPRRVKSLLNSFVVAFRLVEEKSKQRRIRLLNEQMIHSLAKIVYLRNEYPKFFENVCLDHRLPNILANAYKIERYQIPADLKEDIADLIPKYLKSEIEHYDYLSIDNYSEKSQDLHKEIVQASSKQLLRYLSMTDHIYIERELLYLEGVDHTSGLEPEFAAELESLAISNLTTELAKLLIDLTASDKNKAISLLINNTPITDMEKTIQGANVAITLLELVKENMIDVNANGKEIIDKALPYIDRTVPDEALIGAVLLTKRFEPFLKDRIFKSVKAANLALKNAELATLIFSLADDTNKSFDQWYSEIFSTFYIDSERNIKLFNDCADLQENKAKRILNAALPVIREAYLASLITKETEDSEETEDSDLKEENIAPEKILEALKLCVNVFQVKGKNELIDKVVWFLGDNKDTDWYRFILGLMKKGWRPSSKKLSHNLLLLYGYFLPSKSNVRCEWIQAMNPEFFDPENDIELFDSIEEQVLKDFLTYNLEEKFLKEYLPASLNALQTFKKQCGFSKPSEKYTEKILDKFAQHLETKIVNQAGLVSANPWFSFMKRLVDHDLLVNPIKICDAIIIHSVNILELPVNQLNPQIRKAVANFAIENISNSVNKASLEQLYETYNSLESQNLILTEKEEVYLNILLAGRIKELEKNFNAPYEDEDIINLMDGKEIELIQKIAALWIKHFCSDWKKFFELINKFRENRFFHNSLKTSVNLFIETIPKEDHQHILYNLLNSSSNKVTQNFIDLYAFDKIDNVYVGKELIRVANKCQNIHDRKMILCVWRSAKLEDVKSIDNLASRVFLRFYRANKTSANLVLGNFDLISKASGLIQKQISTTLLKTKDKGLLKRATKQLEKYRFSVN